MLLHLPQLVDLGSSPRRDEEGEGSSHLVCNSTYLTYLLSQNPQGPDGTIHAGPEDEASFS